MPLGHHQPLAAAIPPAVGHAQGALEELLSLGVSTRGHLVLGHVVQAAHRLSTEILLQRD